MVQLTGALREYANFKTAHPDLATMKAGSGALNGYVGAGRDSGLDRIQDARARWT